MNNAVDSTAKVKDADAITATLEKELAGHLPALGRARIRVRPAEAGAAAHGHVHGHAHGHHH
jgi:hypothetical protein